MLSDKWTEIEFAVQMLGISEEEAKGIWSILAAICHLGCAGISVGECQGSVSQKSRDFSGAFRVAQFSLYLQSEGVSRHETVILLLLS